MYDETRTSAARVRPGTGRNEPLADVSHKTQAHEQEERQTVEREMVEQEQTGILEELQGHYKKITGNEIAPVKVLEHLARSDVQIYGEQSAESQESHARDALEMSQLAPDELKLPMLFHDVGKAGPDYTDAALSKLIAKMYAYNFPYRDLDKTPHEVPIERFLEAMIQQEPQLRAASERAKQNFVKKLRGTLNLPEDASMRDFYDAHIQWGIDLRENSGFIDKSTAFAAFGHHILPGVMPWDIRAIQSSEKQMGKGITPYIPDFQPTIEDIKLAAGAQTLDYCNARFTRSSIGVDAAAEQTKEALFFAIDNGGYMHLMDVYKKHGVPIEISDEDISLIKSYIEQILAAYKEQIAKHRGI